MPNPIDPPILDLKASLKKPLQWALAAGLVTAIVTLFMPDYYRSEARLLPVESKGLGGNIGGLASAAAAFGVNLPSGEGSDANFVDVMDSRWLKEEVLQTEFQYHEKSWRFGAERVVKTTLFDYLKAKNLDRAVMDLGQVLSAFRDQRSKVIFIGAETRSPDLSQQVVRRASKLLEAFLQEKGHTRGGAKAAFTEARLADARQGMEEAERTLRRFLEENRNYQTSAEPAVRLRGARLETELRLRQQLVMTLAMNLEQALLEEKNDIPILNVLDRGNLPIEKSRPTRSVLVLLAMSIAGVGVWAGLNRRWLRDRWIEADQRDGTS